MKCIKRENGRGGQECASLFSLMVLLLLVRLSDGFPSKYNKVTSNVIRNFVCPGKTVGVEGICMFAWDCIRNNGTHVGTCIDRFYFGSCCQLPAGHNFTLSQGPSSPTVKPITAAPSTTLFPTTIRPPTTMATDTPHNQSTVDITDATSNAIVTEMTPNMLKDMDYRQACGRVFYREKPTARIVNGQRSEYGKWPWQISLRQWKKTTFMHKCGAALLSDNWAITAAHCVDTIPPEDLLLRIGDFDMGSDSEAQKHVERRVQITTIHPDFNPRSFENDLALLRFYEPVSFKENIIPICLPNSNDTFINKTGYVTGWGRLFVDGPLPNILQEVAVPVITNSECEQEYRKAGFLESIPNIFLCAGYADGGKDSCEGDSGGPLVIKQSNGRWVLAGIISWGIGCAEPHQPGVYTRISHFKDWIDKILVF